MIQLNSISKSFNKKPVLSNLSLRVERNEAVVVCGPGGSGKTVLLKICHRLIKPETGTVLIDDKNILEMTESELMETRLNIGMLFQNYALFDSMTVGQNVGFFLANHSTLSPQEIEETVKENLKMVRLEGTFDLMPSELSGGMQKRVGIARALIHRPRIMLYDSPTDGLDPVTADTIVDNIIAINQQLGITSLIISNDMNTVFRLGQRIAFLYDGRIHAIGSPEEISQSQDPYVYQFIRGLGEGPLYNANGL
ncbi:ATP-binding cassette domain-containing protein [bacterium]|nr:ATP-binding cassette domain-containing protein [candidate division CSSED10-310 bacterium]